MTPTVAILYAPGTNCHEETAAALERAGLASELVLLRDLLTGDVRLDRYQASVVPGGFSYGDHLGAGRIFATILVSQLKEQLATFLEAGKPLLGICNGFQVLTEAGILPGKRPGERALALVENESARFEDRFVRLVVSEDYSPWTAGLGGRVLKMPSAHAEGRALWCGPAPGGGARVAFRYCDPAGNPTAEYPHNPSGAPAAVAGITDATGLVLGLMPHPERASLPVHASQDGLELFRNLANWFRNS
ncbi:MAG TPA: phosphoribosylformylglycinamidine synthase I [Terriglobia bacterium]|nr:phosphoribosylformylglycinamidine synthase I [Terriglobia bacterium]